MHRAYAEALRADADADRRAWHLAAATTRPDEAVATELDGVAERAWHRGGAMAVCAAYERAGRLSADRELKARRIARAGQAAFDAGRADRAARLAAETLALTADTGVRADAIYTRGAVEYERTSPRADAELTLEAAALVRDTDPSGPRSRCTRPRTPPGTGRRTTSWSVRRICCAASPRRSTGRPSSPPCWGGRSCSPGVRSRPSARCAPSAPPHPVAGTI